MGFDLSVSDNLNNYDIYNNNQLILKKKQVSKIIIIKACVRFRMAT